MKALFATTNPAKIKYYASELIKKDIEILTLKDLNINFDVNEDGKTAVENAIIKSKEYYNISKILTISIDDSLYIEGLEEEKQPGTNVRRVNGMRLDDNQVIEYYSNLIKELGGKVSAKWIKGIAIYDGKEIKTFEYVRDEFFLINKQSSVINEGYPLDSLTIIPEFNKYLSDLTEEELKKYKQRNNNREILSFILENVKENSI